MGPVLSTYPLRALPILFTPGPRSRRDLVLCDSIRARVSYALFFCKPISNSRSICGLRKVSAFDSVR